MSAMADIPDLSEDEYKRVNAVLFEI